jgi:Ribonuclease G/E
MWLFDRGIAALIEDGVLADLLVEDPVGRPRVGDIFTAKVERVAPKIGGAFVKLNAEFHGFLREFKGCKPGDILPVQVRSIPEPGKDTPVSRQIMFKTRNVMLTPGRPGVNVSRAIRGDALRDELKAVVADVWTDAENGVVIRSMARFSQTEDLLADVQKALAMQASVQSGTDIRLSAYEEAMREWPVADRVYATSQIDWPHEHFDGDLLDHFDMRSAIDALSGSDVSLSGSGAMVVEATRALVAVDINTGGDFSPNAAFKANRAAAQVLPRALKLRGLGGQVVVDFAPATKNQRKDIEATLQTALRKDGIETSLVGWTGMGLFEMQRKRERRPLAEILKERDDG